MSKTFYQIIKNEKNKNFSKQYKYKNKMKTYCLKCKKDTENIDPEIVRTKNNKLLMQSKCTDCKNKKSRFIKEQEAKGLLSSLGIKTPFNKLPILGDILC